MLIALLLAAAGPPPASSLASRYAACVARADGDPTGAIAAAAVWAGQGGGVPAGQCLGLARSAAGDWKGAADAFATTADLAEQTHDGRAADLWVSAGNAALAADDGPRARTALDRALALPILAGQMRGEALLDRARADVALADPAAARIDLDAALALVPGDPMAWLLSGTLARRAGDLVRARVDIAEAARRAPEEPNILLETGTIAAAGGDVPAARIAWSRARAADPAGEAGRAATHALAASGGVVPANPAAAREGR